MGIIKFLLILFIFLTPHASFAELNNIPSIAKILVYKKPRKMYLLDSNGGIYKSYNISLGTNPVGHKTIQGDKKTPEGLYFIDGRNPNSQFHLSLRISYPNSLDKANAMAKGINPGNNIMIHGFPNSGLINKARFRKKTWTSGCIGVTNAEIEEIWALVPDGIPIEIKP